MSAEVSRVRGPESTEAIFHDLFVQDGQRITEERPRQANSVAPRPAKASLITKSPHRKRISGLGSTAGNTGNSGTVNKKELGGE